jgi:hypothetical protein
MEALLRGPTGAVGPMVETGARGERQRTRMVPSFKEGQAPMTDEEQIMRLNEAYVRASVSSDTAWCAKHLAAQMTRPPVA